MTRIRAEAVRGVKKKTRHRISKALKEVLAEKRRVTPVRVLPIFPYPVVFPGP